MCCWGGESCSRVPQSWSSGVPGLVSAPLPNMVSEGTSSLVSGAPKLCLGGPGMVSGGPGLVAGGLRLGLGGPRTWSQPPSDHGLSPPPSIVQGPPEPGFREPPSLVSWVLRSWCQGALCAWSHEVPSLILEGTTSLVIGSPPPGLVSGVRAWSRGAFRILACLGARLRWVPRVGSPRQGRGPGRLSGRGVMTRLAGVRWWCVRVQKRLVGVPRWWVRVQVQLVGVGMGAMAADRGTPVVTFCRGGYGCNDGWYGKWCSEWGVHGVRRPPPWADFLY